MDKASDEGCDGAVRSHNEGLPAGDTVYAEKYKMVAGDMVEKEDEEKHTILKTSDLSLTSRGDIAASEFVAQEENTEDASETWHSFHLPKQ